MIKKFLLVLAALVTCYLAIDYAISQRKAINISNIGEYDVGVHTLYIPLHYLVDAGGDESALLNSYYPGGAPNLQSWDEQKKQGILHNRIRVLITDLNRYKKGFTPEKILERRIKERNATKIIENQYGGLTYRTQPDGMVSDKKELWIESPKRESLSFIECARNTVRKAPYCTHYFYDKNFNYEVSYQKEHLRDWKTIKENVLKMVHSFETKQSAFEYFRDQFITAYESQEEGAN